MSTFEVWQDGLKVAAVDGEDRERVLAYAMHYLAVFSRDGRADLFERCGRTKRLLSTSTPHGGQP